MTPERKIAKIVHTSLEIEDHGCLIAWLHLDYGGSGQGAGGHVLWTETHRSGYGADFIARLLNACGVRKWENLVGRTVYVTCDYAKVHSVEPLPTEPGEAFNFAEWQQQSADEMAT